MSTLEIALLGTFNVTRDGDPITGLMGTTSRALLAYLVANADRPVQRRAVAGLLWPDRPEATALRNLRSVLSRLRKALKENATQTEGEPQSGYLQVTRHTLRFNEASDCYVDLIRFQQLTAGAARFGGRAETELSPIEIHRYATATELYRGEFLRGFSCASALFEEWMVVQREAHHLQAMGTLDRLARYHESEGDHTSALQYARGIIALEPWCEPAHRQVMRALAFSGQRAAAIAQFEACQRILTDELSIEPEPLTCELHMQIRRGDLRPQTVEHSDARAIPDTPATAPEERRTSRIATTTRAGSAIEQPDSTRIESERRWVTILLADVIAPSELRQDAEAWSEAVTPVLQMLTAEARSLGGDITQLRSDGMMVSYGTTVTHEDDPERALLTALRVHEQVLAHQTEAHGDQADDEFEAAIIRLRICVHTGQAIVTAVGRRRGIQGEALEFVHQMLATSEKDGVWACDGTRQLVSSLFEWAKDTQQADTDDRLLCVHQAVGYLAPFSKSRGWLDLNSQLVGRHHEMARLESAIQHVEAGIGGIVTLVGDAGLGKSRLVTEASRELSRTSIAWMEGRCLSYAANNAYHVWSNVIRKVIDVPKNTSAAGVREALRRTVRTVCGAQYDDVYPFLVQMLALPADANTKAVMEGIDAEGYRELTFRAVITLIKCLSRHRPLAIVIEDLHWADPTSLALLERVFATTDEAAVLLICVLRPERDHGCWHILELVARKYAHRHIALELLPLSREQTCELINNLLAGNVYPQLQQHIIDRAEGNPFYIEEILRSLLGNGLITFNHDQKTWCFAKARRELRIPETLRGVLIARIDRLPVKAKRILQLAAMIGRHFSYDLLESVTNEDDLMVSLTILLQAQMIREQAGYPETRYTFKHKLTQEAAHDSLLRRKRRILHRRVAKALEELYSDRLGECLGRLADHWQCAGDTERAIHYLIQAGDQAVAQYANAEAVTYFQRALGLVSADQTEERYSLLLKLEAVGMITGTRDQQAEVLEQLDRLVQNIDIAAPQKAKHTAEVSRRKAYYAFVLADFDRAIIEARNALQHSHAAADPCLQAQAHLIWSRALRVHNAQIEEAEEHLRQGLALSRTGQCHGVEAELLREFGLVLSFFLHEFDRAVDCTRQSLDICERIGDRVNIGRSINALGATYLYEGNTVAARPHIEKSIAINHQIGHRREEAWSLSNLGRLETREGDYAAALRCSQAAMRIFRDTGEIFAEGFMLTHYVRDHSELGQYGQAEMCARRLVEIGEQIDDVGFRVVGHILLSQIARRRHDSATALSHGCQALADVQVGAAWRKRHALLSIGHALADLRRLEEARGAYDQILELDVDLQHEGVDAVAGLANICLLEERPSDAASLISRILPIIESGPLLSAAIEPFWVCWICYKVLRANHSPRATSVINKAYEVLQDLASRIPEEGLCHSYLENVPEHRAVIDAWRKSHPPGV